MDPKLNNGETRSFCMRYERGGAPRVRAHVQNTVAWGEGGKNASLLIFRETNRKGYRIHYLSYYSLSRIVLS